MSLPVTVLSGYLGAGKTTLVNQMLRMADGLRLAVMVNEFGDLPIDADLIEAEGEDMIALAGGCVCCSYGDDLIAALGQMAAMAPPPDHIILEASGVALPGAIAASLDLMAGIETAGIVVLADLAQIAKQLANDYIGDTIERQLRAADLVLLTKGDLTDAAQVQAARVAVALHAGGAMVIEARHGRVPLDVVLHPVRSGVLETGEPHGNATGLVSEVVIPDSDVLAETFAAELAARKEVIRAKGHVQTALGLKTVQVVGDLWQVTDAPPKAIPGVVVIRLRENVEG